MNADKIKQLKEIAERFMSFGKAKPAPVAKPDKYEAAKIKGSETQLEYNPDLTVGSDVMQSGGSGSTPAEDGAVELDNGIAFTVKDGKIASVENDGNAPVDEDTKTAGEKMAALELKFEAIVLEFASVKAELATANAFISTLPSKEEIVKFGEDVKVIGEAVVELSTITVEPAKPLDPEAKEETKVNFEAVGALFTTTE